MIIGLCGSPRNGATEHVLQEALTMLTTMGFNTEFFTVRGKNIGFCTHCDHCLKYKECIIKDDMNTVYSLLKNANGIIIATPVYNGGISAQIKALMDRCRALLAANPKVFKFKIGIAIAVGGDRIGGQELAIQQIHTFYILNEIIPISGGSFGANLGANFWSKDSLDGVKEDTEGFRSLRKTIKKFVEAMKRLEIKNIESK
ncbi:Fe-S cluster protein [miscellaneous Crenarchaeota group-1 archaeon SG8-32-1]|uniref:Fe-S cluster protein n=1 Tax=miscellaneous Crenarchaeota group-1 archaeon SG8-32-1 TaxID=1685124 RepID=A0A0M0BLX3_9ARCH|nr:MAG: Fe-S cluster protein [miscellaneous Crenarchaeota group-1 archaeon SG8-32-1]